MTAPRWQIIHDNKPVVDLHIHPAMNRLVLKQNLGLRYVVSRSFNPLAVRASWPRLHDGGYGAILSVIHLPERGLLDDFPIMKLFRYLRPDLWKTLIAAPYIDATLSLLDDLEESVGQSDLVRYLLKCALEQAEQGALEIPTITRPGNIIDANYR